VSPLGALGFPRAHLLLWRATTFWLSQAYEGKTAALRWGECVVAISDRHAASSLWTRFAVVHDQPHLYPETGELRVIAGKGRKDRLAGADALLVQCLAGHAKPQTTALQQAVLFGFVAPTGLVDPTNLPRGIRPSCRSGGSQALACSPVSGWCRGSGRSGVDLLVALRTFSARDLLVNLAVSISVCSQWR